MKKNDEEYLLAEYLINNKDKLENSLGIRIKELKLIENKENGRVGIEGEGDAGEKISIKLQLSESNYSDLIIDVQDFIVSSELEKNSKIICIVINMNEEIIEELMQDAIFFREKQIELVFLSINNDAIKIFAEASENGKDEEGEEKLKLLKTIFIEKKGMKVYNEKF